MNLSKCSDLPEHLHSKTFNPFSNVASTDLHLIQENFENLKSSCSYFSLPSALSKPQGSSHYQLSILHVNARSLCSDEKFDAFQLFLHKSQCTWQVICVSETWLSNHMVSSRQIPGFKGYFRNREDRSGGGVALYINEQHITHSSVVPEVGELKCTQSLFIKCQISSSATCIVGVIYRPPDLNSTIFMNELVDCFEQLSAANKTTFIAGDFNFDLFNIDADCSSLDFFNTFASYGYWPTIFKTTRISDNKLSLLDNIFCNNLEIVVSSGVIYDDLSDHFPIFTCCATQTHASRSEVCKSIFDQKKIGNLNEYLAAQMQNFSNITDANIAAYHLTAAYSSGIDMFSYKVKYTRKTKAVKPWISSAILVSINTRTRLFKEKTRNPTSHNKLAYIRHRNCLNTILREAKKKYFQEQLIRNKSNSKKMWELLKSCYRGNHCHTALPETFIDESGVHLNDKNEIAESLNKYFISVGEKLKEQIPGCDIDPLEYLTRQHTEPLINFEPTNPAELNSIINDLKNVGPGIDKISSSIFKKTYSSIINHLVHFVNLCLQSGTFPENMKLAIVRPVFKAGDQKLFSNYRPISILPFISKILEKVIHKRVMGYLMQNNLLSNAQFGFRKSLSTYMPVLLLQEIISKAFEKGKLAVTLYIDLKKAFDTVDHDILIGKCSKYGITGTALDLLKSYLANRKQCVEYSGVRSGLENVAVGVPQGSILGPLLFLIYINDLPNVCKKSHCLLYADDTALIFESTSVPELQLHLDQELPTICQWLQANKLSLNTKKTVYQIFNKKQVPVNLFVTLNGKSIQAVEKAKYLGMVIDPGLKWNFHIDNLAIIISRNIGLISRARFFLDKHSLTLLYNSLVLPYINYCCLVWGFTFPTYLHKIEVLQKRAVRIIDNQSRLAHTDPIFQHLKLLKVKDIAKQQLLILMHRKIVSQIPSQLDSIFVPIGSISIITRNKQHFLEPFTEKLYRTRVASWIGPRLWNVVISSQLTLVEVRALSKAEIKRISKEYFISEYSQQ